MELKSFEKVDVDHDVVKTDGPTESLEGVDGAIDAYTPEQNGRILRRIDLFLMPLILSYSALFGLIKDNHLVGSNFSFLTSIFYIGYVIAEWPICWLMQRYSTGAVLGGVMIFWGGLVMCIAACNSFASLAAVRFFIGAAESAITPGFLLLVSQYYTTNEHGSRVLIWSAMNQGFAAFMGVLIYGLGKHSLDTPGSLPGWKSINLFLGAITSAWGIVVFFYLGSPDRVRWLTPAQKTHVKARVISSKTNSKEVHTWDWGQVRECFRDPQVYFVTVFTFLISCPNGGIVTFQGLIVAGLGFNSLHTILLSIPISVFSVSVFIALIFVMKRWPHIRLQLIAFFTIPSFAGYLALALVPESTNRWAKYGTLFPGPLFAVSLFLSWSLIPSNIAGRTKKSAVSAITLIAYCAGNAAGAQAFRPKDAPHYRPGLYMSVTAFALCTVLSIFWRQYYVSVNAKRARHFEAQNYDEETIQRLGAEAGETDQTDLNNPFFRYAI
ncbi:hypothetical protein RQP46_010657 [Phenoliferia psychrophenolica]